MVKYLFLLFPFFSNAQTIVTIAGGGTSGVDGVPATAASLISPGQPSFDMAGQFLFPQNQGHRISKIDNFGVIRTVGGTGALGYGGDGSPATSALLKYPNTVIVDTLNNIFICDANNCRIRKIDFSTGIISTIAGNGFAGFSGDGGPATNASLYYPAGICFDKKGNLYIGDGTHRIRKVDIYGNITTIAGIGLAGVSGDGGPATAAKSGSGALCTDAIGNLYIADCATGESRIAKVDTHGIITTFAGTSTAYTYNGDNIPATSANINPVGMAFDNSGNLYYADYYNNRVRKIDVFGIIHNVAGNGVQGFSGDAGPATMATMYWPTGIALDSCGNVFVSEVGNARIRKITFNPICNPTLYEPKINLVVSVIYPNPSSNTLNIENVSANSSYHLVNAVGSEVQRGNLIAGSNALSVEHLPSGMYMLVLTNGDGKRTVHKIIKE